MMNIWIYSFKELIAYNFRRKLKIVKNHFLPIQPSCQITKDYHQLPHKNYQPTTNIWPCHIRNRKKFQPTLK